MSSNKRRKKTDISILIKTGVFLVVVFLAVFLMLSIMKRAEPPAQDNSDTSSQTSSVEPSESADDESDDTEPPSTNIEFKAVTVDNVNIHTGNLILVNSENLFQDIEDDGENPLIKLYGNKTGDYKLATTDLTLRKSAVDGMNSMMSAYTQLYSKKDLTVTSGYRTLEEQETVFNRRVGQVGEEKAAKEVARSGESDNHTGLAMNFMVVSGNNVSSFSPTGDYAWVAENAFRFGFIQRFQGEKEGVTGMVNIDGYYRYVGLPHSYIMNVGNLALEEYLIYLKTFRHDREMLIQEIDDIKYYIYYHPSDSGNTSNIPVPSNADSYTISGNNMDGFIVTAVMK